MDLRYRSFIFDKDGVLVDTEEAKTRSYFLAIDELLPKLISWEEYRDWHTLELTGKSREAVLSGILGRFPSLRPRLISSGSLERAANSKRFRAERYEEARRALEKGIEKHDRLRRFPAELILSIHRLTKYADLPPSQKCRPIRARVELCRRLQRKGVPTALVTESTLVRTERELASIRLPSSGFHLVACADWISMRGRQGPSPGNKAEMYRLVGKAFHKRHWPTLAVEDTDKGLAAATRGGIPAVLVSPRRDAEFAQAVLAALCLDPATVA